MKRSMPTDEEFMKRCLELAVRGSGFVSPNPMVGCVIVKGGKIVGEGFHKKFGGPHAEVNALREARAKSRGATLYVNLEPCVHHGKTPPCLQTIIATGIRKVIAASQDPNPLVAGRGFAELRKAGIEVQVGVRRREAEALNERFFTFMRSRLPFVGLKLAQTIDGYIADARGDSKWITSPEARKEAHRIRAEYDAILVGANTVLRDDPKLTVRFSAGKNPLRVVLDGRLRVSATASVFRTKAARTVLVTSREGAKKNKRTVDKLAKQGVSVLAIGTDDTIKPKEILLALASLGISSVLLEGGGATSSLFVEARLVDKLHIFVAPKILGGGIASLQFSAPPSLAKAIRLSKISAKAVGKDFLIESAVEK